MKGNEIGEEGAKTLSEILKVNTTLTKLNLSCEKEERKREIFERKEEWMTDNKIGDEGAKALSEMLKVNTTLTSLNLGCEEEERREKREKIVKKNE